MPAHAWKLEALEKFRGVVNTIARETDGAHEPTKLRTKKATLELYNALTGHWHAQGHRSTKVHCRATFLPLREFKLPHGSKEHLKHDGTRRFKLPRHTFSTVVKGWSAKVYQDNADQDKRAPSKPSPRQSCITNDHPPSKPPPVDTLSQNVGSTYPRPGHDVLQSEATQT